MKKLYEEPKYYEIAFSFRDIKKEVNVFEESMKLFSTLTPKIMLEIGCGNSPHIVEILERGYEYIGIDLSEEMLKFSEKKSKEFPNKAKLVCADMVNFELEDRVDFIYIPLGSLYVKNRKDIDSHLNSVGKVLKKDGLYLLDWVVEFNPLTEKIDSWEEKQDGVTVKTQYSTTKINKVEQTYEENIVLDVDDNGKKFQLVQRALRRAIYPQEFLSIIESRDDFDFVGWWNNWNLEQPLEGTEKISRPIVIIKKI